MADSVCVLPTLVNFRMFGKLIRPNYSGSELDILIIHALSLQCRTIPNTNRCDKQFPSISDDYVLKLIELVTPNSL